MINSTIKNKTISTRVTTDISQRAKENLAKQGLTVSEYLRLSLVKAANNEVRLLDFLTSTEALEAKKQVEQNKLHDIGDLQDFNKWIDKLSES